MRLLKKVYNKVNRTLETNKWSSLIDEEIKKESISKYNIPVLKVVKKYVEDNGGSILFVDRPKFPTSNLSKSEKQTKYIYWNNRIINLLYTVRLLSKSFKEKSTLPFPQPINRYEAPNKLRKNYMVNEDCDKKHINIVNGYRKDIKKDHPKNGKSIYLYGSSLVYSLGCKEKDTLTSIFDKEINDLRYSVFNRGVISGDVLNSAFAILDSKFSKGDIVILYGLNPLTKKEKNELKKDCNLLDLSRIFIRPHTHGNVFFDRAHLTPEGNGAISKLIAKEIKDNYIIRNTISKSSFSDKEENTFKIIKKARFNAALRYIDESFPGYINLLKSNFESGTNGIAVMNCNPFTLGHKYLVSNASKMVDNLYVFVVEEDKSSFPYKQRLEMIKEGLKDITNVKIVPTGKFLVSSMTFPDYFYKEKSFNPSMNVTYDFEIFVDYIAPTLNLKNRFIGSEPYCKTTRKHHSIMKEFLPKKDISVLEIERLKNEFGPISASKVRKLIKNKEFDKLDSFLPDTSLDLLTKFGYLN